MLALTIVIFIAEVKCLGLPSDFSAAQEKFSDNLNEDFYEYPKHSTNSVSNSKALKTKRTKFHQRFCKLFYCCFKFQESDGQKIKLI